MDREIWGNVMRAIRGAERAVKHKGRTPRYPHWLIVAMYLWSVFHDRCMSWACERSHYGAMFRPGKLPSVSQFTRRVDSPTTQAMLQHVHEQLIACGVLSPEGYFDGKPLLVSAVSKDRDAARGKISGGFGKGYKLHAFVNARRRIVVWSLMPLNVAEQSVALELCGHLPPMPPDALAMGDSNYDSHLLHRELDAAAGVALLTPLKGQQRVGEQGHHPVTLRQMGPRRREAVELWERHPALARFVLKARNNVEGVFSVLAVALGLAATLPAFARRLRRVRRWIGAKIILYHARLLAQEQLAAAA